MLFICKIGHLHGHLHKIKIAIVTHLLHMQFYVFSIWAIRFFNMKRKKHSSSGWKSLSSHKPAGKIPIIFMKKNQGKTHKKIILSLIL